MKKILFFLTVLLFSIPTAAQTVTINESTGWLESAFVKWVPVSGASSYNVYYTGGGEINKKIDDQLIRSYGSYYRADVPGLAAGSYTLTVKPVVSGTEGTGATTGSLNVLAQDRNGFAFDGGRVPGGYKANGTPKDGAVILYITQNTKNTISVNITGANSNPCVGLQNILYAIKKGLDTRPFIIRMIGNITDMTVMDGGDIVIENSNNASSYLTIEGIGTDAVANGWGVRLKSASNIEVSNIGFMNCNSTAGDNVGMQQDNDHVWVHNCDMFYGDAGVDADQIKGDGALDNKSSTYITLAYNHFWDSGKACLLGLSEGTTVGLYITYHHNWFDHSDSRHPRVRYYSAHIYNNYYDGNSKYGAGSTLGSSLFMEGNFFRNCKYPMLTSKQGTDIFYDSVGTFSGEAGGTIKSFNNTMSGQTRYVPYNASTNPIEFDAIETATRDEVISTSITSKLGGNTYNNFDTNPALYITNLTIDQPAIAKTKVMQYAGRVSGGDLKWIFNNALDDASSTVITGFKSALTNYTSTLVSVQGESTSVGSQTLTTPTNNNQTVVSGTAINNIVYTWGGDATDATVTGLPASGISFVKNATAKTITISGTPTATVSYSITTSGTQGTPITGSGTITVTTGGTPSGDEIHNFTISGKISSFYTITGNMNSSDGLVSYESLTLTKRLKMESSTSINFTTTAASTVTLVFDSTFTGTVKINNISYTALAGIVTVSLAAGANTITKGTTTNLFYIRTRYTSAPPSIQTLTATANTTQSVSSGTAISSIVYTWGGTATDASVTGLPASGISFVKNATAKTITISGTPTANVSYSVSTSGTGTPATESGTITVTVQTLTASTNNNQTVPSGTAISAIVYTWGGDATDATVTGLPASGISFVKNATAKTITISGTPTANVSYSVTTSGAGLSVSASGTITVTTATTPGDQIHNFTTSGKTSSFYTISGNMNSTDGLVTYNGLTLTKRLKMESSTSIKYTTTAASTLTLVFDSNFTGTIKVNNISYTAVAGIVTVSLPAGVKTITKGSVANLYYIRTKYNTLVRMEGSTEGLASETVKNNETSSVVLYPNPVTSTFYLANSLQKIERVIVYNMAGTVVKSSGNNTESVDMSDLSSGTYLVKINTDQGILDKVIIKK